MSATLQAALNLGPIDQVGFVVSNLEEAMERYRPLFGDFSIMEAPDMDWNYRGRQENSSLRLAFARSGDIEIELIEWLEGETPHKEFLDAGREGLHHLRFRVTNLEAKVSEAEALGYRAIWTKRFADTIAAAYLERDGDPLLIEFYENTASE
ncbi:4-hydroxyphenylpyruvate dioxygenase-like putative hemolysin [Litorivivens lipolytica]|uniref:4-hydroxyphenylpyruvate dioxygenase-like putative hemolysin n=1 Tax=Litorivivens lipolytica TaxID=1524264 RepID=A0A7W4W6C7_9GAMM|nr:VOC family protein [Litorivivens lipolytica]MBB3048265.1 4-hydroxyphenylpyruvate dioxygenase-like putative hemolysin [Litorivivens lipolytica]